MNTILNRTAILATALTAVLMAPSSAPAQAPAEAQSGTTFLDAFDGKQPAAGWTWLREHPGYWRMKDGGLEIRVEPGKARDVRNALVREAPDRSKGAYLVEVTVTNHTVPTHLYEQAGITWYKDGKPVLKLVKELVKGELMIIPGRKPMTEPSVRLRLIVTADSWTAQYQPGAKGPFLEAAKGKLPPPGKEQVSLQCYDGPPDAEHWIRFDDFRIAPLGDGATTRGIIDPDKPARPADAVQLVGPDGHQLVPEDEKIASQWVFADGVLTASPKWDSLVTREPYRDFRMHLEFNVNDAKDVTDPEKNGNSGVYIQQRYELQILNSFGVAEEDYKDSYCGSLYRLKKPDVLANKRAGEWQSLDIAFRAARYEGDKKVENARITVYQNGQLIHDNYSIPRKTGVGKKEGPEPRPIKLQGHHNPVRFRNVWIQKLDLAGK